MQAHSNASEYIPIALILLGLTEAGNFAHLAWLHFLGVVFTDVPRQQSTCTYCATNCNNEALAYSESCLVQACSC